MEGCNDDGNDSNRVINVNNDDDENDYRDLFRFYKSMIRGTSRK